MTEHHAASRSDQAFKRALRNDPAARQVYRMDTLADLDAAVDSFGITDPQHRAVMRLLVMLAWKQLREMR